MSASSRKRRRRGKVRAGLRGCCGGALRAAGQPQCALRKWGPGAIWLLGCARWAVTACAPQLARAPRALQLPSQPAPLAGPSHRAAAPTCSRRCRGCGRGQRERQRQRERGGRGGGGGAACQGRQEGSRRHGCVGHRLAVPLVALVRFASQGRRAQVHAALCGRSGQGFAWRLAATPPCLLCTPGHARECCTPTISPPTLFRAPVEGFVRRCCWRTGCSIHTLVSTAAAPNRALPLQPWRALTGARCSARATATPTAATTRWARCSSELPAAGFGSSSLQLAALACTLACLALPRCRTARSTGSAPLPSRRAGRAHSLPHPTNSQHQ